MTQPVQIGDATLWLGDCLEILPTLGRVDAVITDPPYGIGVTRIPLLANSTHEFVDWDADRPPSEIFKLMLEISREQIIWGGNYFTDRLPPSQCWLIWDKMNGGFPLADCEMAWTSRGKATRMFKYHSATRISADGIHHPTQKPVQVMKWCLGFVPDAVTILDPFMGSGSTGVACARMGKRFIGIEREQKYFDVACRRIEQAYAQPDMFVDAPAPAEQLGMVDEP